jgi:hypothetical protein
VSTYATTIAWLHTKRCYKSVTRGVREAVVMLQKYRPKSAITKYRVHLDRWNIQGTFSAHSVHMKGTFSAH